MAIVEAVWPVALVAVAMAVFAGTLVAACLRQRRMAACWAASYARLARRLVATRGPDEIEAVAVSMRSLALIEAMDRSR